MDITKLTSFGVYPLVKTYQTYELNVIDFGRASFTIARLLRFHPKPWDGSGLNTRSLVRLILDGLHF
jgi:hypothetical protein